jgi:large subunit ribosomal protein L6
MSRIGKMPIDIPQGVTVDIKKNLVVVKGPKGELQRDFPPEITIKQEDGQVIVTRQSDHRTHRAKHGLTRALLSNMVTGVSNGFRRDLHIEGVGYRAGLKGKSLELNVGYSHPVVFEPPEGIAFEVDKSGRELAVTGVDKQVVGEIAAQIRRVRPPEPYKGKGIRYVGERIRRKAGKAGKATK